MVGKKRPRPNGKQKAKKIDADGESNQSFDDAGCMSFQDDDSGEKDFVDSDEEKKVKKALGKRDNAEVDSSVESEISEESEEAKDVLDEENKSIGNLSDNARKIEKAANKNGKKKLASPEAPESEEIDDGSLSSGLASLFDQDSGSDQHS